MDDENDYDVGPDGKEVRDEFGIWNHVLTRFFFKEASELSFPGRLARVNALLKTYNEAYVNSGADNDKGPCTGLRASKKAATHSHRCSGAFCPSCWAVAQMKCLACIRKNMGRYPHVYLRETNLLPYQQPPHEALVRKLRAHGTNYKLLAWTVAFSQDPSCRAETVENGTEVYAPMLKYVGIWGTLKPVREAGVMVEHRNSAQAKRIVDGAVTERGTGQVVGSIHRLELDVYEHARQEWLDHVGHPSDFRYHSAYASAIVDVNIWLRRCYNTFGGN